MASSSTCLDLQSPVADYQLAPALPKQLKGEILTVKELESAIDREYETLKKPGFKRPHI
jgi:hypothetical protein